MAPAARVGVGLLPAFNEVSGQNTEFFSECFGKMAEVGKPDLAAGLLDADLTIDQ